MYLRRRDGNVVDLVVVIDVAVVIVFVNDVMVFVVVFVILTVFTVKALVGVVVLGHLTSGEAILGCGNKREE